MTNQPTAEASVAQLLRRASGRLSSSSTAHLDAELIMAHVLDCDRAGVYRDNKNMLTREQVERYCDLVAKRMRGRPIAHITEVQEFWSLDFAIDEHVLIPRPETELLVETALSLVSGERNPRIADLGAGCGAVAVAIGKERPDATVVAVEKSAAALNIAAQNCRTHAHANVTLVRASWLATFAAKTFNLIVSNPPYICSDDPALVGSEIRFEPRCALASGLDGFTDLRAIIRNAGNSLIMGGMLALEHGYNQAAAVRNLMHASGFSEIATQRDLAGHERVTHGAYNRP